MYENIKMRLKVKVKKFYEKSGKDYEEHVSQRRMKDVGERKNGRG